MTALVCISLILCSLAGYTSSQQTPNRIVGEKCERDIDCIEHAFCRWQQACVCDPYYSPSLDKSTCIATAGLNCFNDIACQSMANGECKQNTCACKDDFFLDSSNSSNCISRPAKIGDRCQVNTVCQESFNLALCISEKCHCYTGHHFVNETGECVQSQGLYYPCTKDHECYENDKTWDAMECKNHQCVCKEGETCAKGSLMTAAGALVAVSFLLQGIAH
jgi:hypothetical protein